MSVQRYVSGPSAAVGLEPRQPVQQQLVEGPSHLIVGTMAGLLQHHHGQVVAKPPYLLGHLQRHQPVAATPHQQQRLPQPGQQRRRHGPMGPQGHGDAHRPQRPHRSGSPGRPRDHPVQFPIPDHRPVVGRLDAQIQKGRMGQQGHH
jgi:hypothetical protein